MKMVRMAACCAVAAFAAGVATPQTQAEMIVGAWNCSSDTTDGETDGGDADGGDADGGDVAGDASQTAPAS